MYVFVLQIFWTSRLFRLVPFSPGGLKDVDSTPLCECYKGLVVNLFFSPTSSTALCASISSSSLNEIHSKSGNNVNINYHSSKYSDSCFNNTDPLWPLWKQNLWTPPPRESVANYCCSVATKISSCRVNTTSTSRQGIKHLGIS